eukprot:scpid33528/ scgid12552/ ABC transporter G family member 24; Probable white-brown complex homolog protein 25
MQRCGPLLSLAVGLLACSQCPYAVLGYTCIDEGEILYVPIPKHNETYPNAIMCKDLTPDRNNCIPLVWTTPACQGGYYRSLTNNVVLPCPAGFYCPINTICLVPCPLGAYCVTAKKNIDVTRNPPVTCDPDYGTQQLPDMSNRTDPRSITCGGPAGLDQHVICKEGFYCPNISMKIPCPEGSYCRSGRISPQPCPILSRCKRGSSAPIENSLGLSLIFDLVLIFLVILFVLALRYKEKLKAAFGTYVAPRLPGRASNYEVFTPEQEGNAEEMESINTSTVASGDPEQRYSATPAGTEATRAVSPKDYTMEIEFHNLGLTLESRCPWYSSMKRYCCSLMKSYCCSSMKIDENKVLLQGATGKLRPKTLTAIMGGSGAGKTTLLNTLSGKAYYGAVEGDIMVNGKPENITTYRSITGFVPQEDIMHRELTTREVLYYQGILRLSGCATFPEINRKVDEVLELLGLMHIKDSQIGDEEKRGISGGQRKRVNIGMELVADPTLLFLDEPTSGLDSVSSMQVCEALRRVAEEGHLTVVAVLHQPRFEIFQMFHEVILLQPGGQIAFQGSTQQAEAYFSELGYPVKTNVNPSDHYLDVINDHNKKAKSAKKHATSSTATNDSADGNTAMALTSLGDLWTMRQSSMTTDGGASSAPPERQASTQQFTPRKAPAFWIQLLFFIRRAFVLQIRQLSVLILDQLLVLIAGAVLGALYREILLRKLTLLLCMTSMAVALTSMLAALRCFGSCKPVFWRESAAGINRPAYFLATNISQIPIIVFTPLVFLSLFYALVSPRALFRDYYTAILMLVWASHGLGYLISTIFNSRSSQMATVVLVLVSAMMSGAQPSLCKMKKQALGPVLYSLSFARWFVEALFEKEANRYPPVHIQEVALYSSYQGYPLDNFALCIGILFVFGLVSRIIALICLMFTHRGQQK